DSPFYLMSTWAFFMGSHFLVYSWKFALTIFSLGLKSSLNVLEPSWSNPCFLSCSTSYCCVSFICTILGKPLRRHHQLISQINTINYIIYIWWGEVVKSSKAIHSNP